MEHTKELIHGSGNVGTISDINVTPIMVVRFEFLIFL
jgi:hypothetical protein